MGAGFTRIMSKPKKRKMKKKKIPTLNDIYEGEHI